MPPETVVSGGMLFMVYARRYSGYARFQPVLGCAAARRKGIGGGKRVICQDGVGLPPFPLGRRRRRCGILDAYACRGGQAAVERGAPMRLPDNIDIETTLFSGQTFMWKRVPEGYLGCVDGNAALLRTDSRTLFWEGPADAAFWARYFDLGRDYLAVAARFSCDAYVAKAFAYYGGMRILRQPVWETLCAFIISANNNIKRICGIMSGLCEGLGSARSIGSHTVYAFPDAQAILRAGEDSLRRYGLGYRAPYLYATAKRVEEGFDLAALPSMGYDRAVKELTALMGVGEKVADCILLFSCGYSRAFPVDVWVRRVMRVLYGTEGANAKIKAQGYRLFGEDAGIVQQVLFHGARMGLFPELCEKDAVICAPRQGCAAGI